jgi:hypothetical protein
VFQKILQVRKVGSLPVVRTTCHPVRTLICPQFQSSGRRAIPSGHQTDQASFVRTTWISIRTLHCIEKLLCQLASVRTTQQPVRTMSSDRSTSDSFQVQIREDWCNRPDDVDSRPDALIHKARIAIQIQPSGLQSAWSGRALNRYENCVLKINRPDGHPPSSGCAKPYMEITCSGRATVRTIVPHRPNVALKQERFSAKISEILVAQLSVQTAHVHRLDSTRIFHCSRPFEPQPINRALGHWELQEFNIEFY